MRRRWQLSLVLLTSLMTVPFSVGAQVDLEDTDVEGIIDIHAHVGPETSLSPFRRSVNAIEAAQIAKRNGMRGLVFKHHYLETASWAYLNVVITSDTGQRGNPVHPDAFKMAVEQLREAGFTQGEIDTMTRRNPARFLGLEEDPRLRTQQ